MIKLTLWTRRREGCCTVKHSQEKYILCDLLNKNSDKVNTLLSTNCSMPIPLASATSCRGFQQFWQQLAKKVWPLFRAQFLQIQDAWGLCCMYSRFQISPQALNKKFFYWAGHFLSPLFLPFLQLFLSECACVLRIIVFPLSGSASTFEFIFKDSSLYFRILSIRHPGEASVSMPLWRHARISRSQRLFTRNASCAQRNVTFKNLCLLMCVSQRDSQQRQRKTSDYNV